MACFKRKKLGIINAGNYGDIILNPEFKDRIYSRGVFVTRSGSVGFGYNLNLTLDRDRNCITDYKQFAEKANSIIFYILDNYNTLRASFGNFEIWIIQKQKCLSNFLRIFIIFFVLMYTF